MASALRLFFCSGLFAANCLAVEPPPSSSRATPNSATTEHAAQSKVRLLSEGTFVVQRTATLKPVSDNVLDGWIIEFDQLADGRAIPPMKVIASSNLSAFARSINPSPDGHRVTVSGRVLAYRDANYLLLTAPPRLVALTDSAPKTPDPKPEKTNPEPSGPFDPSQTIDTMKKDDAASGNAAPRETHSPEAASKAGSPRPASTRPEGTVIVDRASRCVVDSSGRAQSLTFEADSNGLQDPPLALVPCRLLERMETQARQRGDATRFIVSGQVIDDGVTTSILLTSFRIPYDQDNLSPAQNTLTNAQSEKLADH